MEISHSSKGVQQKGLSFFVDSSEDTAKSVTVNCPQNYGGQTHSAGEGTRAGRGGRLFVVIVVAMVQWFLPLSTPP